MDSRAAFNSFLSTSEGNVSSSKTFEQPAPDCVETVSGPKAHIDLAANKSQSYFARKWAPTCFFVQSARTSPRSKSSATPSSNGSAIIVSLFRLFGVSEKHFNEDVSTTVSQNATTGSATLISTDEYISLKSCIAQSRYSSPVPTTTCSPLSSTFVRAKGYDFEIFLRPSVIFGNSAGFSGSTASFTMAWSSKRGGSKMAQGSSEESSTTVAVFATCCPTPSRTTQLP